MKIAIIGTGNVGMALAKKWKSSGHEIYLGVRNIADFKGKETLEDPDINIQLIPEAVNNASVILLATPATSTIEVVKSLGNTSGKTIIDAMNIIMGKGPEGYLNTTDAVLANTETRDVVKSFNTTGFNNMADTIYNDTALDMFVAGDSEAAKSIAIELSEDAGFESCYDVGGNDKFTLMEQFAWFWINLAMFQGQGREIGFKLLKRKV